VSGSLDKTLRMWQLGTGERGYGNDRGKSACIQAFTGHKVLIIHINMNK
jgi:glucose repression regulatory protein TUP1